MSGETKDYEILMPDDDRRVVVRAAVWYDRGRHVVVEQITARNGTLPLFSELPLAVKRRLLLDLVQAEQVSWAGGTTCKHGRYLVRDFCVNCLAEAKS